ncbi:EF hand [Dictyocaulus viviparus]|uniref:EF hand n=1 Tax=Dictyocaulus viviparus TaxID=29172 RepID=A0A0D8XU53_DICVI|nr:EF hand [Dictyocaulus viviparus]
MRNRKAAQENDINGNGGISFREFTVFTLNMMNLNRSELERLFLTGDVDRNSELDNDECILVRDTLKATLNDKAVFLFDKYDKNNDQVLTLDEVSVLAKNEFGIPPKETRRILSLTDKNDDHVINVGEEMSNLMWNLRTQAVTDGGRTLLTFDRNHDGKVSYEEIKNDILRKVDGFTLKQIFKSIDFDKTFDRNHDGKVSYEEIKNDILRKVDGFTLKQIFKSIDFDKDYHLTAVEYLALLNELEEVKGKISKSTPKTIVMAMSTAAPPLVGRPERKSSASSLNDAKITKKAAQHGTTSDKSKKLSSAAAASSSTAIAVAVLKIRDKRDVVEEMVRVTPTRKMHEISLDRKMGMGEKLMYTNMGKQSQSRGISKMFRMFKGDSRKRTRREAQEIEDTAPIVSDVPTEIITEEMRMLSQKVQNNLSGGGRSPSIDESVTVPYDSEDFQ